MTVIDLNQNYEIQYIHLANKVIEQSIWFNQINLNIIQLRFATSSITNNNKLLIIHLHSQYITINQTQIQYHIISPNRQQFMYSNKQQNNFSYSPDDTDRSNRPVRQSPLVNYTGKSAPGTKSFHIYNTLLLIFIAIQVALYATQGVMSQCSQLSTIFYGFMGVYIFTLMVPIITLICNCTQKGFTFVIIYTLLAIIGKIGVIVATFLATQNHVGYCYVATEVKVGIAIANAGEIFSLCVQLLFIRHLRKVSQLKEVQMFMEAGKRKGYF